MTQFMQWCQRSRLDWTTDTEIDGLMVMYFDKLFWLGTPSADGSKALAALKFFLPSLSRLGAGNLPRAHRALTCCTKLRPGQQRVPLPLIVMTAILGFLCRQGEIVVALMLLLQFRTYLRPGVCDHLKVKQLIATTRAAGAAYQFWAINLAPLEDSIPGKTGQFDKTVLLDTDLWLSPFLTMLTSSRDPEICLWPTCAAHVIRCLDTACTRLGLESLNICRYSLRHGGASHDILSNRRSLLEVKRRGLWRSDASLKRYGKEAKVLLL